MNCNVFAHQYKWSHNSYYFTHISNSWMPRGFVCNYEYLQTMHMYRGFKSETIIKNLTRHYNYINIQIWSQLVFHAYITLRLLHFLKSLEQHFNDMTCTIVSWHWSVQNNSFTVSELRTVICRNVIFVHVVCYCFVHSQCGDQSGNVMLSNTIQS